MTPANDATPPAHTAFGAVVHSPAARLTALHLRALQVATATDHPRGTLLLLADWAEEAAVTVGLNGAPGARDAWIAEAEALRADAMTFPEDPYSKVP